MAVQTKAFVAAPPKPAAQGTWRLQRQEQDVTGLAWVVAIAGSFLLVGLVGIYFVEPPMAITMSGRAGQGASDANTAEMTMAELQATEQTPEVEATQKVTPELPQSIEVPTEAQELPEMEEALAMDDVFKIPAAPQIETAIKPMDPAQPKPRVVAQPRPRRATSTAAVTPGGTQGSGGGAGGNGAIGSGSGVGKFPKPNYPSTARARGATGSTTLVLRVNPAGKVENASVVSSTGGFNSQEWEAITRYIERYWQFPPGAYRTLRQPMTFKLDSR